MPRQARAEATRRRLLDATVEALVACGYAGTTTQEVCRRAEVSRGTLLHHFPTRHDLLLAALQHVLSERVASFVADRQQEGDLTRAEFLQRMWAQWQGPALVAWLELAVASRTDEVLRDRMRPTMQAFDQLVLHAFAELRPFGELSPHAEPVVPFFVFALLNGLAVGQCYEQPGHQQPVLDFLVDLSDRLEAP